jgi:ribosomal protein L29
MEKSLSDLSADELQAELARLKESLCDIEEMHAYSGKTQVHIGGETARSMQEEFEEECRELNSKIAEIEKELKLRGVV